MFNQNYPQNYGQNQPQQPDYFNNNVPPPYQPNYISSNGPIVISNT